MSTSFFEPLESRQLLTGSVIVDTRLVGGGSTATVSSVGQRIDFEVWATVTGNDSNNTNEGLQIAIGSLLSSNVAGGSAGGTITAAVSSPFTANGSSSGAQADLDGDGDLDVGSNNNAKDAGFLFARSASMTTSGTPVTGGQSFKIATGSFTVTSLLNGISTVLSFRPRVGDGTVFEADGTTTNNLVAGNVWATGAGITLKRPGAATIQGRVFNDTNANGIFDGADTGIDGFRVFLDTDFDGQLDSGEISKPVSATGTYTFTAVPSGVYRVREVFREGWRQTFPALGYYEVQLAYGAAAKSQSFANTDTVLIKGNVFMDANVNHKRDSLEPGLSGWMLYIDHNNDGILNKGDDWALSDSKGNYRFFNLPAGTYVVRIVQQTGYRQTAPSGGSHTITLGAGGTVSNKNFGEKRLK